MASTQITWNNTDGTTSSFAAYKRSIDCGNGQQFVSVYNGQIVRQELRANEGVYTGDGNPEIVGQTTKAIRGWGFRRIQGEETLHDLFVEWSQSDVEGEE
jgi:hypothetical protein